MAAAAPLTNGTSNDNAGEVVAAIQAQTISADEIALYDRQIRLWGVQAQEKIRTANILLISAKALANEVAKNLVLAGIGSLTIVDHETVTEEDLGSQFFISDALIGQNRTEAAAPEIRRLNPRVTVKAISAPISDCLPDFYTPFTLVIATDLDFNTLSTINAATRLANKPMYAAGGHGMYGYIFADLIQHDYVIERAKSNMPTVLGPESGSATRSIVGVSTKRENGKVVELVTKREIYSHLRLANSSPLPPEILNSLRKLKNVSPLLPCFRALWDFEKQKRHLPASNSVDDLREFTILAHEKLDELQMPKELLKSELLRSFLQNVGSELAPVTAFLGGQLAQDVINVLGRREQPIQNLVLFDGEETKAPVYSLHSFLQDALDSIPPPLPGPLEKPMVP
ncbi:hypothetical protein NA57DRAFT_68079 [Rhizodiscina lignyota]|uniref:Ubiquitin-like 1-activating enzyme E1A n=1 Tax=Rhizodiscina lignyota TaxID=1504668 RepID=A0A9P4M6P5_9PEZI|nr:hypothetical protein NA57DRAFT_68079 [Rhizodiscina lignyota]